MSDEKIVVKPTAGLDDILGGFGDAVAITIQEPIAKKRGRAANDSFDIEDVNKALEAAKAAVNARKDAAKLDKAQRSALTISEIVVTLASQGYTVTQLVKALSFKFERNEKAMRSVVTKVKTNHLYDCVRSVATRQVADKYCSWAIRALHKHQKGQLELVDCSDDKNCPMDSKYRVSSTDTVWGPTMLGFTEIELREKQLLAVRNVLAGFKDKNGTYVDGCPLSDEQKNAPNLLRAQIESEAAKFWTKIEEAESRHRKCFPVQRERNTGGSSGIAFDEIIEWDEMTIE